MANDCDDTLGLLHAVGDLSIVDPLLSPTSPHTIHTHCHLDQLVCAHLGRMMKDYMC